MIKFHEIVLGMDVTKQGVIDQLMVNRSISTEIIL